MIPMHATLPHLIFSRFIALSSHWCLGVFQVVQVIIAVRCHLVYRYSHIEGEKYTSFLMHLFIALMITSAWLIFLLWRILFQLHQYCTTAWNGKLLTTSRYWFRRQWIGAEGTNTAHAWRMSKTTQNFCYGRH
jgi:hypothetical protein